MTHPLRIIGCGGRSLSERLCRAWLDRELLQALWFIHPHGWHIQLFATGMGGNADAACNNWAIDNLSDDKRGEFPADWINQGDKAGGIRNRFMFRMVRPNILIAFPGFDGTDDMVSIVEEYNNVVPVSDICHIIKPQGVFK